MLRDLYIVGTGGLAREIAEMLPNSNLCNYRFIGFISENSDDHGKLYSGHQVVGSDKNLSVLDDQASVIIGIGHASIRKKVAEYYQRLQKFEFPNVFDNTVRRSDSLNLGIGNVFLFNSFVSADVVIGNFNLINWCATIGHDSIIGNGCIINPHAHLSGHSNIGDEVLVGAGASVLENCSITAGCLIGAGAVVTKNIFKKGTYIGLPAKERNEDRN